MSRFLILGRFVFFFTFLENELFKSEFLGSVEITGSGRHKYLRVHSQSFFTES